MLLLELINGNLMECQEKVLKIWLNEKSLPKINFNGHCLIKNKKSIPKNLINSYVSDTLGPQLRNTNTDFRLINCLFGFVKLTKNTDPNKYKCNGCSIEFDSCSEFSFTDWKLRKKCYYCCTWYELIYSSC